MSNDLGPESQPWRREVERTNADNANDIASIRTGVEASQRAAQGVLSAVAAANVGLAGQAAQLEKFSNLTDFKLLGVFEYGVGEWVTLIPGVAFSPDSEQRVANYFIVATLLNSFSGSGAPGRLRVSINGEVSSSSISLAVNGYNYSSIAYAGTSAPAKRLDIEVQAMLNNPNLAELSSSSAYANQVRFNFVAVWS